MSQGDWVVDDGLMGAAALLDPGEMWVPLGLKVRLNTAMRCDLVGNRLAEEGGVRGNAGAGAGKVQARGIPAGSDRRGVAGGEHLAPQRTSEVGCAGSVSGVVMVVASMGVVEDGEESHNVRVASGAVGDGQASGFNAL